MPADRPNILFIMDDQHRFDYLGCAGADFLRTPNLDRLAARGVRFTQCYTNAAVSAPARIGLAAGMQPCRLGSLDNLSYLPRSATTFYQRLRDADYRTGCIGKLDLAKPDHYNGLAGQRPTAYGFGFTHPEEAEGKMHAGQRGHGPSDDPDGPFGPYTRMLAERGLLDAFQQDYARRAASGWVKDASHDSVLPTDAYEDDWIGRRGVEFLETVPEDFPWFHFISFVGPHDPFDPPTEYADRWRAADVPPAVEDSYEKKPEWIARRDRRLSSEEVAVTRRQYCAEIELIDDWVGRAMDALERRGMLDNTVIIFTSDHGEMLGDHGLYTKSCGYDPAARVPLIVAGPGIEGGRVSDALVELIDLNPTVCDLAGLTPQENIDARSVAPLLAGPTDAHRDCCVSALRNWRMVVTERYKLIQNYNEMTELYDRAADPHDLTNIAADHPDVVRDMMQHMHRRFLEGKWNR